MHTSKEPNQAEAFVVDEEVEGVREKFGLLGRHFYEKSFNVERLAESVREYERKLNEVGQQSDEICFENNYLEGRLEVKNKLAADLQLEKDLEEESIQHLRDEVKYISESIKREKTNGLANLSVYEDQVRAMGDLFLRKRKSYGEMELKLTSEKLGKEKISLKDQVEILNGDFQRILVRKENIENSYMQVHATILGETQNLVGKYMEKGSALHMENKILQNKIENIERYVKDVAA